MLKVPTKLPQQLAPLTSAAECKTEVKDGECPWMQAHSAEYANDLTILDGTTVRPGEKLSKSWIVLNTGSKPWPATTKLQFLKGNEEVFSSAVREFPVDIAAAGTSVTVTVDLIAPEKAGPYTTYFILSDGIKQFGSQLWIKIEVAPPAQLGVTPRATVLPAKEGVPDNANLNTSAPKPVVEIKKEDVQLLPTVVKDEPKPVQPVVALPVPQIPAPPKPTSVAPPPKPTPPPVKPAGKYAEQQAELAAMGFNNRELNDFLLEKHNGSLQQVCNWLVENMGRS